MNIGYYLRDSKGKTPQGIRAIFRVNQERFKIFTDKKIEPKYWSISKHQVLSAYKYSQEYNKYLSEFRDSIESVILQLQNKKIRLDEQRIQEELDKLYKRNEVESNKDGDVVDFISFVDEYIKNVEMINPSSLSEYKQLRVHFIKAFNLASKKELERYESLGRNNKTKSEDKLMPSRLLDFESVNLNFLEKFKAYLYTCKYTANKRGVEVTQSYKVNYIDKVMKLAKQLVDSSIDKLHVKSFRTKSIKTVKEDVDSVITDFDELQEILNVDLSDEEIEMQVRDKYVTNCFLGFRYSDLNKLDKKDFKTKKVNGMDEVVYTGRNQKTDKRIEFVVHPTAVWLLEKYNYQVPIISESTYNEKIKVIAMKAGLSEMIRIRETRGSERIVFDERKYNLISSHTGRRSFCTNFYVEGVPIQAIMSVSGHKTEHEFLKYINKDARVSVELVATQIRKIKQLEFAAA